MIVTNAGWDAVDAAASGVKWNRRAGSSASDDVTQTNGAEAYGKTAWSWHPLLVSSRRSFDRPDRVRQNINPPMTEARTNSSPGRSRHKL